MSDARAPDSRPPGSRPPGSRPPGSPPVVAPARARLADRYRAFLPITDATPCLTLGEGFTPLVRARRLGAALGLANLYLKVEGQNPTGSFKDRGMVVAVSKALEAGATAIVCASTGNTSASAAAYAAAAGIEAIVVLPRGQIAHGKLLQALVAGARVVAIDGNFDAALRIARDLAAQQDHLVTLVNSVNPFRIDGQQTAAFEVCDDLGGAPDCLAIPVGNAGNITAYWAGFRAYRAAGLIDRLPRMLGFQAAGAAPIVLGRPVEQPETVATAIRIGNPASWQRAIEARDESGGRIEAVSDDEILAAYRDVATLEGVFCEPSSAASVAGLRRLAAEGSIESDETVVCVLTGNGLKDPDTAARRLPPVLEADATLASVVERLGW
ncbi:MAG TPA: threonine synthase [Candidatus Saccharimonadales bacterium]|nr:threonine synthase [Candidatus Saccharimonadales bacterium]